MGSELVGSHIKATHREVISSLWELPNTVGVNLSSCLQDTDMSSIMKYRKYKM
jgi:hypothetical protein